MSVLCAVSSAVNLSGAVEHVHHLQARADPTRANVRCIMLIHIMYHIFCLLGYSCSDLTVAVYFGVLTSFFLTYGSASQKSSY